MLLLQERGWDIHYMNMCTGNGGSVQMDGPTTAKKRLEEGREAARILGAAFYPPICDDLELNYTVPYLRKIAAVVREAQPSIVLTHAPSDYMEDHMQASRLAVTAAHGSVAASSSERCAGTATTPSSDSTTYSESTPSIAPPSADRAPASVIRPPVHA